MGSISEALRRAQQEREAIRQRRIEEASAPSVEKRTPADAPAPASAPPPAAEPVLDPMPPSALPPIDLDALAPSFVVWHDRGTPVSEQYRALRTRLMNFNEARSPMVLAITSSMTGEGKTTSTLNVAMAFAELQHLKVLAVDADLRRCSLTRAARAEDDAGVCDLLRGERQLEEVLRPTTSPNLFFLPAGRLGDQNAAELLGSHSATGLIAEFRRRFHYVFVDLPPANAVADASILGALCDGAVLVVRMHKTAEPNAKHAVRLLESSNVRLLGCLLIGQWHWKAPWLHEYGYGYDYQGSYSGYYQS